LATPGGGTAGAKEGTQSSSSDLTPLFQREKYDNAAEAETTCDGPRARLAVLRFENHSGQDWGYTPTLGEGMARKLQAALSETQCFRILTRRGQHLKDIRTEKAYTNESGEVDPRTAIKQGKQLGARLVVTATITDFSDTTGKGGTARSQGNAWIGMAGDILGKMAKSGKAYMEVNVEVLDVETSELVATKQVRAEAKDTQLSAVVTGELLQTDINSWDNLPRGKVLQEVVNKAAALLAQPGAIPRDYFSDGSSIARRAQPDSLAAQMQEILKELGYYNGRPDGMIGPVTVQAIQNFQREHGLEVTGALDLSTTKKLLELKP
jgi:curli biogenesis system outer membrane secretion channel CsgG